MVEPVGLKLLMAGDFESTKKKKGEMAKGRIPQFAVTLFLMMEGI
jgi:hypothetical protein